MQRRWILAAALALATGCGGATYQMTGVGPAVGADGRVAVAVSEAGNRQLDLHVTHLLPPERLGREFEAYHVWVAPLGGSPQLLGRLEYDEEDRRGHLTAVTPHEGFRLIITSEPEQATGYPSGVAVFDQYIGS